ncbi:DUF4446 family protein [Patescibacteria group bacterium]|nr:DUF4446 family protein [Patescibacteria group bacterium]
MTPLVKELLFFSVAVSLILAVAVFLLERKLRKLLRGNKTKNIEETLVDLEHELRALKQFQTEAAAYLKDTEKRLNRSVQGIGMVRFNPFRGEGMGGSQSFASSFLSEKGDGLVLSSLYARDRMSVFAKPVKNFKSEYELTDEEKDSLQRAKESMRG